MYGLVVELEIGETEADRAIEFLHQVAVPTIEKADAAAARARRGPPPGAPSRFVSAEIFEVMAEA